MAAPAPSHPDRDVFLARVEAVVELLLDVVWMDRLLESDGLPLPVAADPRYPAVPEGSAAFAASVVTGPRSSRLDALVGETSWEHLVAAALWLPGLDEDALCRLSTSSSVWSSRALPRFLHRAAASPQALANAFYSGYQGRYQLGSAEQAAVEVAVRAAGLPLPSVALAISGTGQLFYSSFELLLGYAAGLDAAGAEAFSVLVADELFDLVRLELPSDRRRRLHRLVDLAAGI